MDDGSETARTTGVPVPGITGPATVRPAAAMELRAVTKDFPGVTALDGVSFSVRRGEIHALLGENGAGKSTLIKIMTGVHAPDRGTILLAGRPVTLTDPHDAAARGVSFVPQDLLTVPHLSVGRNMLLGREKRLARSGALTRAETATVTSALAMMGADFPATTRAGELSVPQLRAVQIARALINPGDVLILDEPTAVLSEHDGDRLLERLRTLRERGKAIVYVSHRLSEVLALADRVTVLRDGRHVGELRRDQLDRHRIVELMAKDDDQTTTPPPAAGVPARRPAGDVVLEVSGLFAAGALHDVQLTGERGQIIGIAGVQGSGHGELLRAIAGVRQISQGEILVDGKRLRTSAGRDAYRRGVLFIPADRRRAALVPTMSVRANIVLSARIPRSCRRWGLRWPRRERSLVSAHVDQMSIRTRDAETPVAWLSGGTQQKVALARALAGQVRVLLVEEPTQGIDVHAKKEIRRLLRDLADGGACVVIATSEFEELPDFADVVHVLSLGRQVATLPGADATYHDILAHALP